VPLGLTALLDRRPREMGGILRVELSDEILNQEEQVLLVRTGAPTAVARNGCDGEPRVRRIPLRPQGAVLDDAKAPVSRWNSAMTVSAPTFLLATTDVEANMASSRCPATCSRRPSIRCYSPMET
jgi:hypothetical protein